MFAIAFDLEVAATKRAHPRSVRQAYLDLEVTLGRFEFRRIQGSVFVTEVEDLANLFQAMSALKALPWVSQGVSDIRAFRIELWSDFTSFIKH